MKRIFPLLLLLIAGCATHQTKTAGFEHNRTEWDEEKDFYYHSWLGENKTAAEKKEERDFYYGSWLRNN